MGRLTHEDAERAINALREYANDSFLTDDHMVKILSILLDHRSDVESTVIRLKMRRALKNPEEADTKDLIGAIGGFMGGEFFPSHDVAPNAIEMKDIVGGEWASLEDDEVPPKNKDGGEYEFF